MRIASTIWLQIFVLIAMFAFTALVLRPEPAEAASRKHGKEQAASLTGRWAWRASCPGGQYRGAAYIAQHSVNRFSGRLGNTSFYDRGSISAGRLQGRKASFILNAFGKSARINALLTIRSGGMVARAAYSSQSYGRCMLVFTKVLRQ
jgi:hypothetical protein